MSYTVAEKVQRVLRYVFGPDIYDGDIVTGIADGYAEPGYGSISGNDVVVFGNWNDKQTYLPPRDDESVGEWVTDSTLPSRLARTLERIGAEVEWYDEWYECQGCYRAVRATGDSYMWKPSYSMTDGEILCHDCLRDCGMDGLSAYINNASTAVTWADGTYLESFGFVKHAPGDPQTYENGWFPGQDDNPETILAELMDGHDDNDRWVVFLIDSVGQFDMHFSAYVYDHPIAGE